MRVTDEWICPFCRDKSCKAYNRDETPLGPLSVHQADTGFGWKRQQRKDEIRELQACKKRMNKKGK